MTQDTFIKLIQNPNNISKDDLEALELVSESFSYTGLAKVLISKANKDNGSMFANQKLKHAALFSSQRNKLRQLLSIRNEPKVFMEPSPESLADISQDDKTSLEEVIATLEKVTINKPELVSAPIVNQEEELVEKKTPLKFYVHSPSFGKDLKKVKVDLISEYLAYRSTPTFEPLDINTQSAIIQSFLSSDEPKTIKADITNTQANEDLSRKSIQPSFEIITENMANIFVKQQKYKKAIEVFEKLILKYPDKSTYFAEKITHLTTLL